MNITDTVVMVPPRHFNFNAETAKSNSFQNQLTLDKRTINQQAHSEFNHLVTILRQQGINVLLLESPDDYTPDAVFPNNWFSTHRLNNQRYLFLYPMLCENRKKEVQLEALQALLLENLQANYNIIDFRKCHNGVVEGTGALVFDRQTKVAFMSISERANINLATRVTDRLGYELILFTSHDRKGQAIYHTNVIMSVGEKLAFICLEAISGLDERKRIEKKLHQIGKNIIDLTLPQIYGMAGNVLELQNQQGEHFLLLSTTANNQLTTPQKKIIDQYCKRLSADIKTIESVGGGSVRCMLAEIFY